MNRRIFSNLLRKAILLGRQDSGLSYSILGEVPSSQLPENYKCSTVESLGSGLAVPLIYRPLEMVLCFLGMVSLNNSNIETRGHSVYQYGTFEPSLNPS